MAIVTYTPTFQHEDWVDNVDRVQAGGSNGFNIRFTTVQSEFQRLGQVVQIIDGALSSLGQQVSAPVTVGLPPILQPFGANPLWSSIFWSRTSGGVPLGTFVEKPTANATAFGVMPLSIPNGVKLATLRVVGDISGGAADVSTDVFQELRNAPFTRATLVTVTGLGTSATPPSPFPGTPVFDAAPNLYYALISVQNAAGTTVRLRGLELTYQP